METDNESNMSEMKENGNLLRPVNPEESGEGLPYAPVDWPNPGDIWGWKVGRRVALKGGHYLDRYLYLPSHLCSGEPKKRTLASKLSVEHYIRATFPNADIDAFFASFSWKIPSKNHSPNGKTVRSSVRFSPEAEHPESVCQSHTTGCKAGNKMCSSFIETAEASPSAVMPCDICCAEPWFCRECCCILCSKTVTSDYRGYSNFKCQAIVGEGYICGHVAHINCALRSYLAGTVGGSIGLDAEYYCRRCDARTDLVPYVKGLLQNCEDINSRDDLDKILNIGLCILRGSQKIGTRELLNSIELAKAELKYGASLEDICKVVDATQAISTGIPDIGNATLEATNHQDYVDDRTKSLQLVTESSDYLNESLKLENEIDEVLQALRKSQELEYKIAEEQLYAQKNYLRNLYQQLDRERSALAHRTSHIEPGSLLTAITNRLDQVNREIMKLKEMAEVAKGFGKIPNRILKEHFGIPDIGNATLEATNHQDYVDDRTKSLQLVTESSDYLNESLKLENEIDEVLQALRKSQELEYKIAEEQLYAQKNYLRNLYQQLDRERSALAHRTSHIEPGSLLTAITNRLDQVNREIMKLKEMAEVAKGFGKIPNRILKEHFGMEIEK